MLATIAFEAARRRRRPSEIALLLGLTRIGVLLVALEALLVLPFGLRLVHLARRELPPAALVVAIIVLMVFEPGSGAG